MQNMNFPIAYLLTKHECVIIPGFGAFVASGFEKGLAKEVGLLCTPAQSLGFNPEIKHNDGLLASFVSKSENISYKEACLKIQQYTDYLNSQLSAQRTVHIQWVGRLSLSVEQKIIFTPSYRLSCNADNFGLSNFYMPPVKDIEKYHSRISALEEQKEKDLIYIPVNRQIIRWAGSVAAAILALFLVCTPLNESSTDRLQQAGFVPVLTKTIEAPPLPVTDLEVDSIGK
jgi:nucleoid DNA-binding protein